MKHGTMRAWQLAEFGMHKLHLGSLPIPKPGPGDILVRVKAVSLNYRDKLVIEGHLLPEPPVMPFVPVSDFSGEVVALGDEVTRVEEGDRVMGNFWTDWISGMAPSSMMNHGMSLGGPMQGALAEYIVIPEHVAVKAPLGLSDAEAATLPIAGLTAWFALTVCNETKPDDIVVVQGTGGVALWAAQLAKTMGAKVIVLSRSADKLTKLSELEPWRTINTSEHANWSAKVLDATGGGGAQHVIELIGGDNLGTSIDALAPGGQISMIGFLAGMTSPLGAVPLMLKRARIQGVSVGNRDAFDDLVHFVSEKEVRPYIDSKFAFDQALDSFERLDEGPFGKVVVTLDD